MRRSRKKHSQRTKPSSITPLASGNYVAENGTDTYVAENGTDIYVTET
jgi:hypothetical protein